jgi:hypothetical protein
MKYADLDQPGPINRALGQEGAQKLNQRRPALVSSVEAAVYRLAPELSSVRQRGQRRSRALGDPVGAPQFWTAAEHEPLL